MKLEPGAMRELHWHTSAAEGYITKVKQYESEQIWTTPDFQQP